jgi:hypothetical protein
MNKIEWNGLPDSVTSYLDAHKRRDVDRAMAFYVPDAVVTDEGHDYRGVDAIRAWLTSAGSEYTYTTTFLEALRADDDHVDVVQRLEGDFPGGVADLHFRFALDGERVARLVIEP